MAFLAAETNCSEVARSCPPAGLCSATKAAQTTPNRVFKNILIPQGAPGNTRQKAQTPASEETLREFDSEPLAAVVWRFK